MLNPFKDRNSKETSVDPEPGEGQETTEATDGQELPSEGDPVAEVPAETSGLDTGEELAQLQDRYLRLAAEFENFRKRTRKEQADSWTRAQADLALLILPTLDDLARVADTPHDSTTVEALDKGIELILTNLRKQLGDAGLERIEALEQKFDPELHQAIMTVDTSDASQDETVSRVLVDGYVFKERLVRPAQVEVRRLAADPGSEA